MSILKISLALLSTLALNSFIAPTTVNAKAVDKVASAQTQVQTAHPVEIIEEKIGDKNYQVSRVLVHVKPEHVWHILTDYDNAPDIFPCLKKCKVVKDKGTSKLISHQIKPSGVPSTFEYVIEVKEVANKLYEWHRVSGDFREVDGFWKLEPQHDGNSTLVTYASYVNGGLFLPAPLIKRQVRMDIPAVMSALKQHAETNRQIASGVNQPKGN